MNKKHLKTGLVDRLQVVDNETGEVLVDEVRKFKYLSKNKEQFYLIYTSILGVFKELSGPEIKVYCFMLEKYLIGSEIGINAGIRAVMAKDIGISTGTVANCLGELVNKKLIYNPSRGIYKLNPRYAFQGSTEDRNKMLKMVLELECPNC